MSRPLCRKCLFEDIDREGIFASITELVAAISEEKRTDEKEYRRRLELCRECEFLGEGTCGKCGCFVELRAAYSFRHCPSENPCW